jgi:hypothetical protein
MSRYGFGNQPTLAHTKRTSIEVGPGFDQRAYTRGDDIARTQFDFECKEEGGKEKHRTAPVYFLNTLRCAALVFGFCDVVRGYRIDGLA